MCIRGSGHQRMYEGMHMRGYVSEDVRGCVYQRMCEIPVPGSLKLAICNAGNIH